MRSRWTPSIVQNDRDVTVYIVEDHFGKVGRGYRETEVGFTDIETTIQDLITGQYNDPIRAVSFNTAERWSAESRKISLKRFSAVTTSWESRSPLT